MLNFIYRLVREFEREHGIQPNLLYLNRFHAEHLKLAFDESLTMPQIRKILGMEMVVENDIMHPRVAWTQVAHRAAC